MDVSISEAALYRPMYPTYNVLPNCVMLQTTLMDVLAGRKTGGRCEGEMLLNGHTKVQATFARVMGYGEMVASLSSA